MRRFVLTVVMALGCAHRAPPLPGPPTPVIKSDRLVLESHKPLVSFRLFFLAGSVSDPPGKEGLTALTSELMVQGGTDSLSSAEFQAALFPLAAEFSVENGAETTVFVGRVHQDLIEKFLPLLTDALAHPRFDPREFERLRGDALDELTVHLRHNDDEQLGKSALQALLYDGHPYGYPTVGTVAGLRALTLDDVKEQWKRVFTRDRLTIGLIGQRANGDLADRLAQRLAALPRQGAPLVMLPAPINDGIQALFVEKSTDSTAMSLGYSYGEARSSADFIPLWVGNSALGEHRQLGGILFHRLREQRGLNYGDYTYIEHFVEGDGTYPAPNQDRRQQDFSVWLRPVQNENRGFALRAVVYEIERVLREGLTAEQVERTKAFLRSYTLSWQASDSRKLGYALDDLFNGTPDFLQHFRDGLPAVTVDQVNAALRAHVDPKRLRFAIVTQGALAFQQDLLAGKATAIKYDSPKAPDLLSEDHQIDALLLGLTDANTRVLSSDQLFVTRALTVLPTSSVVPLPVPGSTEGGSTHK